MGTQDGLYSVYLLTYYNKLTMFRDQHITSYARGPHCIYFIVPTVEQTSTFIHRHIIIRAENRGGKTEKSTFEEFFFPDRDKLMDDVEMPIWDHLEELRERVLLAGAAGVMAILICFYFSKDLVVFLEAPVSKQGVQFLQLSPGEFFFTTLKVSGYAGLLLSMPTIVYQVGTWISPGLTSDEKKFLSPIFLGSSLLFLLGVYFSYQMRLSCLLLPAFQFISLHV